uniref:Uncharacterized protein n=1 Tax=Pyramimonas obovata TaxID=1411642 RepID=A0A7S0RP25_9CHLO|mmetsp:Transcript_38937/g.84750  ORF Transcript_38937/g.84750 Transcript_38937/m.84750 type:complete len:191 (+) Transcript_38937:375-947(+)
MGCGASHQPFVDSPVELQGHVGGKDSTMQGRRLSSFMKETVLELSHDPTSASNIKRTCKLLQERAPLAAAEEAAATARTGDITRRRGGASVMSASYHGEGGEGVAEPLEVRSSSHHHLGARQLRRADRPHRLSERERRMSEYGHHTGLTSGARPPLASKLGTHDPREAPMLGTPATRRMSEFHRLASDTG